MQETTARRVVLVTGPSGAGRSSAIRALEDIGFEAIDNMPLRLLSQLLETPGPNSHLALGIDPRTRDFSVQAVEDALADLQRAPDLAPELLYLDCDTDVLQRRFSETRRRHPMGNTVEAGIERELSMLSPVRDRADMRIDTSTLNVHELRAEIDRFFSSTGASLMAVSLQSFSYKRGVPRSVDIVFDCRFLQNPYWEPDLRTHDGRDAKVRDHIAKDPNWPEFKTRICELVLFLLPLHRAEGKSHLSIAFGCTGGQHRSVAMVETLSEALADADWQVSIRHRELNARSASGKPVT